MQPVAIVHEVLLLLTLSDLPLHAVQNSRVTVKVTDRLWSVSGRITSHAAQSGAARVPPGVRGEGAVGSLRLHPLPHLLLNSQSKFCSSAGVRHRMCCPNYFFPI